MGEACTKLRGNDDTDDEQGAETREALATRIDATSLVPPPSSRGLWLHRWCKNAAELAQHHIWSFNETNRTRRYPRIRYDGADCVNKRICLDSFLWIEPCSISPFPCIRLCSRYCRACHETSYLCSVNDQRMCANPKCSAWAGRLHDTDEYPQWCCPYRNYMCVQSLIHKSRWEYSFSVFSATALGGKSSACAFLGEETIIFGHGCASARGGIAR